MSRKSLIAAIILAPIAVLLLVIVGIFGYLQSDSGRALLVTQIEGAASTPGEMELELGPLDGNIFGDFIISNVRLRDSEGEWLTADNINVSWSPLDLISGTLTIHAITAESLAIDRQPILPPAEESSEPASLPSLPVNIQLSHFEIEEIRVAEPVVGYAADLTLLMNVDARMNEAIHGELKLAEKNVKRGGVFGSVDFDPARETLAVDVNLDEPDGGLLSRLLALPGYPAIKANIVGNGVLNAWRGQLSASAGKLFDADFSIATQGAENINIQIKGGGALDRSLADDIPLVDDSRISVSAALIYNTTTTEVTITNADVENAVMRAQAIGAVNPESRAVKLSLKTTLRDTGPVNELIEPATVEEGELDLDIEGTFDKVTANALVRIGDLDVDGSLAAQEVTGTFTSELDLASLSNVPLKGSAALVSLSKLPTEALNVIGENLDIDFELDYGVESERLTLNSLRLHGEHIGAEGKGQLNVTDLSAAADLSLTLDDLSRAAPIRGKLIADLDIASPDVSSELTGNLKARAADFDLGDASLTPLVGTDPTLSMAINLAGEKLSFTDIALNIASGGVAGEARLPLSFETIEADMVATLPTLAALNKLAGVPLGGNVSLKTHVTGPLNDPAVEGVIEVSALEVDGTSLGTLEAKYNAAALASSPIGELSARLRHDLLTATASAKFALPEYSELQLSDLAIREQKNSLTGNLTVPFDGTPLIGVINGSIPSLTTAAALIDERAGGSLDVKATLANQNGGQSINATVSGKSLSVASVDVAMETLSATVKMTGNFEAPLLDVTVAIKNLLAAGQSVEEVTAEAQGNLKELDYHFGMARGQEPELKLAGNGSLSLSEAMTEIRLVALDGAFSDKDIKLTTPLMLTLKGENIEMDKFALSFGEGILQGSANYTPSDVNALLNFKDLPIDLISLVDPTFEFSGGLDGDVSLQVAKGAPAVGDVNLKAKDVRLVGKEYNNLPSFESTVTAKLQEGELAFKGDVKGLEATSIEASGQLPLDISPDLTKILINDKKPVNLVVLIDSDINKIWPLLALDTQQMRGQLKANVTVGGTIDTPNIAGKASVSNGYFEEVEQGTILKDITLDAEIVDQGTLNLTLSAQDPKGGRIDSKGSVTFDDLADPAVNLNIKLAGLLAVNRDDIQIITDGDMDLKGGISSLNILGDITTQKVEINIGGAVAPNVVDLKVEEVNKPGAPATTTEGSKEPSHIMLNMTLNLPKRVFIRGRGLDSEWEGRFTIKGTADKPLIDGYLSPVRGQFTFAGKAFVLKEGAVSLLGEETIDPELSLKAQYDGPSVTAVVTISGTASNPQISFSSPDGLPQDEVLSQVLFGKSAGKLTALEAVQLAETLATLSGKLGSGGGITGFVRDTLGVDVVSAGTNSETGETEVSVGKYVTDNIYIGVDQGTQSSGTRAKVQIDLTPNISLESEMGQSTDSSVGIFWKWDY